MQLCISMLKCCLVRSNTRLTSFHLLLPVAWTAGRGVGRGVVLAPRAGVYIVLHGSWLVSLTSVWVKQKKKMNDEEKHCLVKPYFSHRQTNALPNCLDVPYGCSFGPAFPRHSTTTSSLPTFTFCFSFAVRLKENKRINQDWGFG